MHISPEEKEQLLTVTLAHEFQRCRESFDTFVLFASFQIKHPDNKTISIGCYNLYSDFLSHLYEFYLGCIKRNNKYPNNPTSDDVDSIMNKEVEKQLKIRRDRIIRGDAPSWENDISHYDVRVPNDFGKHFRIIRNRRSHADFRRASSSHEITLSKFYRNYHKFVMLLFESPQWIWNVENINSFHWKEIETFTTQIKNETNRN